MLFTLALEKPCKPGDLSAVTEKITKTVKQAVLDALFPESLGLSWCLAFSMQRSFLT